MNALHRLIVGVTLLALPAAIMAQNAPAQAPHPKPAPKPTVSAEAAGTVAPTVAPAATAPASAATKSSAIPTSITIARETFDYARTGRRDPYTSLMSSSDLRPLISDLKLTSVAYDSTGLHSVAILRDLVTKERYMLKVGQKLGRLRVANIKYKSVVFSIDEFGFNRQETLQMSSDTSKTRTP
ncbi:MAG: hypothetical protein ABI120_05775 [Gemmatimonadaceae bacterium]